MGSGFSRTNYDGSTEPYVAPQNRLDPSTSASAADQRAEPVLRTDPQLTGLLSAEPTVQRRFARGDTLTAFAEVYSEARTKPDEVRLTATLTTTRKSRVRQDAGTLVPGQEGPRGYTVRLPLADLVRGE